MHRIGGFVYVLTTCHGVRLVRVGDMRFNKNSIHYFVLCFSLSKKKRSLFFRHWQCSIAQRWTLCFRLAVHTCLAAPSRNSHLRCLIYAFTIIMIVGAPLARCTSLHSTLFHSNPHQSTSIHSENSKRSSTKCCLEINLKNSQNSKLELSRWNWTRSLG